MDSLFTKINKEDLLDGDVVKIEFIFNRKSESKSIFGKIEKYSEKTEHAVFQNGELLSVIDNQPVILEKTLYPGGIEQHAELEFYLHNYMFVSKEDEWYIEGTEAYPDGENYGSEKDWKENGCALFQGLTYKENFNEMEGTGPCWDGETCSFSEFEITERFNQTRHRKLNRILNDR